MLIDNLQYNLSPGFATSLWANSLWNIIMAHLKKGLCRSSLNTNGDEIWYGILATHTSKKGKSVFKTSPTIICNLDWYGVPWTRFCNSATNLGSISHATTPLVLSSSLIVMFPVPGPISKAMSVSLKADFSTILWITSGFFRICWPKSLLKRIPETIQANRISQTHNF